MPPLPHPGSATPAAPFATLRNISPNTAFYEFRVREGQQRYHPDLPPSTVWGYEDVNGPAGARLSPGPTFVSREGTPMLVRFRNELPRLHTGFGMPNLAVHHHGGDQAPEDDGHPEEFFRPGESKDYY